MGGWGGGGDGVGTGHDLISSVKGDSAPRDATFKPYRARTAGEAGIRSPVEERGLGLGPPEHWTA